MSRLNDNLLSIFIMFSVFSFLTKSVFGQDCEYKLNIYARSVTRGQYGGSQLWFIINNTQYPNIKYIPSYGKINFKGYDSVVVFYATKILYPRSLSDIYKYTSNHKVYNKEEMVRAIIIDGCTSKEIWIMEDYSVIIDNVSYNMSDELLSFLGKNMPPVLRENWEIHYDYGNNRFYIGPYQSPVKYIEMDSLEYFKLLEDFLDKN